MTYLPQPVKDAFEKGKFPIHEANGKFNGVCTDMALDQTYNCEAKTQLFKGITLF